MGGTLSERDLLSIQHGIDTASASADQCWSHSIVTSGFLQPVKAVGLGGAPTRATILPEDPSDRKQYPIASGVLAYFPRTRSR
jgi:hypothetical protein